MTTGAAMHRYQSKQDYRTPDDFREAFVRRFGSPGFDLAADEDNTFAPAWYSKTDDALTCDWRHPTSRWLNPPFGTIAPWVERCAELSDDQHWTALLVPASVGSLWFTRHVFGVASVVFLRPRISFDGANPFPKDLMLAMYGREWPPGVAAWDWRADEVGPVIG